MSSSFVSIGWSVPRVLVCATALEPRAVVKVKRLDGPVLVVGERVAERQVMRLASLLPACRQTGNYGQIASYAAAVASVGPTAPTRQRKSRSELR